MKNIYMMLNQSLIKLPSPSNISVWWNLGFMLGMILLIQLLTGLFLSMHYFSNSLFAFMSIAHIMRDVDNGWLIQTIHMNGASLFFILIYVHVARGLYYSSYKKIMTWMSGFIILILVMLSAFLGYVLPWGQMSFWGATVITNLLSAIPYIGNYLVIWIWGGFSVDNATLSRFFIFHFLFPLIIIIFVMFHLIFLHEDGSFNPLGTNSNFDKISFSPYFMYKDMMGFFLVLLLFSGFILFFPTLLSDPDNFMMANPMTTPIHIQPEWYFLFAYAILRSIPNKLGGVIALLMSLMVLLLIPLIKKNFLSKLFSSMKKIMFWLFIMIFMILTFIGASPVEEPYFLIGQITSCLYFMVFFGL